MMIGQSHRAIRVLSRASGGRNAERTARDDCDGRMDRAGPTIASDDPVKPPLRRMPVPPAGRGTVARRAVGTVKEAISGNEIRRP